jgi:arsenate reductase (thioredoxin)
MRTNSKNFDSREFVRTNVLFLCRANSARSITAEAITNYFSGGRMRAFSAGIEPADAVPGILLKVLRARHIPTAGLRPKLVQEFFRPDAPQFDFVITTCDPSVGEKCPIWPGQPVRAHWAIEQPQGDSPASFEHNVTRMYDHIFRCVNAFLNLPYDVMDRLRIQTELSDFSQRFYPETGSSSVPSPGNSRSFNTRSIARPNAGFVD